MNQKARRQYLLETLLKEEKRFQSIKIPNTELEERNLLRSLMNIRYPKPIGNEFLEVQDAYLHKELEEKGITDYKNLEPIEDGIYLWQGDITTLKCGAIVNAANSGMTGCYVPCHRCIDNCIHTYAGIQLRNYCDEMMQKQGMAEPTGQAKITPAFNLPCDYVIHTVGPIVGGRLTQEHCDLLESCYVSCLNIAEENGVDSIAFCCISTGEFHFPNEEAARIAVDTVRKFKKETKSEIEVIFNVFKELDYRIYRELLG